MPDVIMISQGQGLACRKQHRVVSDAVELKIKGRIEILDIKKKLLLFIASCSSYYHGTFIFFYCFFIKNL